MTEPPEVVLREPKNWIAPDPLPAVVVPSSGGLERPRFARDVQELLEADWGWDVDERLLEAPCPRARIRRLSRRLARCARIVAGPLPLR